MPRVLHIADVHFDTGFGCKSERVRASLRSGVRKAFERAVDDAVAEQVDALVIAGDLFDNHRVRLETERFVLEQLGRLQTAGIPVMYATGNHDPMSAASSVTQFDWPDNVVLFGELAPRCERVAGRSGEFRVVGAGHDSPGVVANLASAFPVFDDGVPTIGLLHTNVESHVSSRDHRPYAPCVVGDLEVKGYDYWALGHVHGPSPVGESGSIFYSGCLQGRHFREAGARGGYLVTLEAGRPPVVEERRYASVQWEEIVVDDVGASARLSDLDREVGRRQTRLRQTIPGVALAIRVVLRGATARWAELRDDDQIELMASRWQDDFDLLYVEIDTSETHRPLDLESLRNEPTVLSEAMRLVDSLAAADEGAAALLDRVLPEINRAGAGSDYLGLESLEIEALLRDVAERLHEEKE